MVVSDPCRTCGGSGVERRPRTVKVKVPAGVSEGQRIRLKGRGAPGRGDGPPGDLYVVVHVGRHELFGRRGQNLTLTVPVTYPEAALGADIKVPTLTGEPVTIRIPPGTRSGRTFKVKSRGAVTEKGTGDLLVSIEVTVPDDPSPDERKAIEQLAQATASSPRAHLGV
jgi:molecular chaperone DnaJ